MYLSRCPFLNLEPPPLKNCARPCTCRDKQLGFPVVRFSFSVSSDLCSSCYTKNNVWMFVVKPWNVLFGLLLADFHPLLPSVVSHLLAGTRSLLESQLMIHSRPTAAESISLLSGVSLFDRTSAANSCKTFIFYHVLCSSMTKTTRCAFPPAGHWQDLLLENHNGSCWVTQFTTVNSYTTVIIFSLQTDASVNTVWFLFSITCC